MIGQVTEENHSQIYCRDDKNYAIFSHDLPSLWMQPCRLRTQTNAGDTPAATAVSP